jgi:DNA-directed RNA polymerase subunit RPC12/RpoP
MVLVPATGKEVHVVGHGRTVGLIFILVAMIVILAAGLYLFSGLAEHRLTASGFMLGLLLVLVLALPLMGAGVFLRVRGRGEEQQFAQAAQEKKLLNIVRTHGKADIADVALEMNLTRDQIKEYIYDLVGKGLFTGYINWNEGVLYAREAAEMRTNKCPNCGGIRELVGKGIVKCPYCGSELFL